jgi:threonine dehydrogenase-like Zn-dependent dehydrogenase
MRQLVTRAPGELELREVADPTPARDEALVAVEAVGICGSDLHLFTGEHPYARFPNVQGHEFGGRVISLPIGYAGTVQVGQRVAVEPLLMCGECLPCRRGRGNCCVRMRTYGAHIDGALSELIAVPPGLLYDADDLSAALAALVEPMSIGQQAIDRAGLRPDDLVVIYGAGPIGLAVLLGSVDRGCSVLVVDRVERRLELAHALGALRTVDATFEPADASILDWTGGEGPTVVFECTGVPAVLEEAIRVVASSGTVVVLGLSRESVTLPMVEFTRKELTVVGSRNNMGHFGDAVDLVRRRATQVQQMITHRFPMERGREAFALALNEPSLVEKVIVEIGERA